MNFQPFIKWTGSKREVSKEIIKCFPKEINTFYDCFCGGCSITYQLLESDIVVNKIVCNDINEELIKLFNTLKNNYQNIINEYEIRWKILKSKQTYEEKSNYYYKTRENYNNTKNIYDFLFLTRTCYNGLIRYNSKKQFNSPFHIKRDGINPDKYAKIVESWNNKLKNAIFINNDYKTINPNRDDYVFCDPPYANTKSLYFGGINLKEFWNWLNNLKCSYSFTFDGKTNNNDYTQIIDNALFDKHIYLNGKVSGFRKLKNNVDFVKESLYIKDKNNEF